MKEVGNTESVIYHRFRKIRVPFDKLAEHNTAVVLEHFPEIQQ